MALEHVVWIGGGTGAGKTTVAHALASRHGLRAFHVDAFWYAYDARLDETPLTPDEQWLGLTPAEQAVGFEETSRRRMKLVFEDLAVLPTEPPIVVEGPQVVPDLLPARACAVFLIPTPSFQRSLLEGRPMPPTSDPRRTLENRIEKDRLYAERVAALAAARGFEVVVMDGTRSREAVVAAVEHAVSDFLGVVREPVDLRPARRWQNEAKAENLRSWLASPDVSPDAPLTFEFVCECGRLGCDAQVALSLADFDALPRVVASAHAREDERSRPGRTLVAACDEGGGDDRGGTAGGDS